jgi:hypothetical protein
VYSGQILLRELMAKEEKRQRLLAHRYLFLDRWWFFVFPIAAGKKKKRVLDAPGAEP